MNHVVTVKGRTAIRIVVQPSAQKTKFIGLHDGMLKLAVAASPVDGRANKEIITYLAKFFDVKKSQVHIFSGERSRKKLCSLANLKKSEVRNKLIDFGG